MNFQKYYYLKKIKTFKSPWNNINRAFMEIENLGAKLEDEGKVEDLKFLYKIKDLLENIENEFK